MDSLVNYLYSNGDMLMMACKVIVFVFSIETFAYIVSMIMGVAKCSKG